MPPSIPSPDTQAVLAVCHLFLSSIKSRSPTTMLSLILPGGHATLIRPSRTLRITLEACVARIDFTLEEKLDETIARAEWEDGDDGDTYGGRKTEVRVDGELAVAWMPYVFFFVGGKLHHEGTNTFTLLKKDGEWRISGIADNCRML